MPKNNDVLTNSSDLLPIAGVTNSPSQPGTLHALHVDANGDLQVTLSGSSAEVSVNVNNSSGADAVNIQDGGNSITVDGTLTISGSTFSTASNPASIVGVTTSSAQIVASNSSRKFLKITNDSDTTIYLAWGSPALVGGGERLNPRGAFSEINYSNPYTGAIFAIHGGSGTKNVGVIEA